MSPLAFEKWEGLGNDFVVVDAEDWAERTEEDVRAICDRHRGVGADGVLVVDRARPRMIVWNADGSRPEMCGNGLRCVAAFLRTSASGGAASEELLIDTDAGPKACRIVAEDREVIVSIDMGTAIFEPPLELEAEGVALRFHRTSMGNPHAISFEPRERSFIDRVAPTVERTPVGNTNVEFVTLRDQVFDTLVWERGVGYTQACGTGACAVAATACREGLAAFGTPIQVRLLGGPLEITVADDYRVQMTGPARLVFRGIWR